MARRPPNYADHQALVGLLALALSGFSRVEHDGFASGEGHDSARSVSVPVARVHDWPSALAESGEVDDLRVGQEQVDAEGGVTRFGYFRPRHGGLGNELQRHATQRHPELGLNAPGYLAAARGNIADRGSSILRVTGGRFAAFNAQTGATTIFSHQGRHGLAPGAPTIHSHYVGTGPPTNSLGALRHFPTPPPRN